MANNFSNQKTQPTMTEQKKSPLKKIRAGSVTATIWQNDGENGEYLTCAIERSYKDKKDQWQTTTSYASNDLANLAIVTAEAQRFMMVEYPAFRKQGE